MVAWGSPSGFTKEACVAFPTKSITSPAEPPNPVGVLMPEDCSSHCKFMDCATCSGCSMVCATMKDWKSMPSSESPVWVVRCSEGIMRIPSIWFLRRNAVIPPCCVITSGLVVSSTSPRLNSRKVMPRAKLTAAMLRLKNSSSSDSSVESGVSNSFRTTRLPKKPKVNCGVCLSREFRAS